MISTTLAGAQTMIHFYELPNDSEEYEKFAQITDDGEIIEGADRLLSIYPKERWEEIDPERILASFNNGQIMASHEDVFVATSDL